MLVVFLMKANAVECVAFASQYHVELFWAVDRALQRPDHGVRQPLEFCSWNEGCWARIARLLPGTAYSASAVRAQFAGDASAV